MNTCLDAIASNASAEEIRTLTNCLKATHDDLVAEIEDLTADQYTFKPAADCWSIAEILEHVVIVDGRVQDRIRTLPEGEPAKPGRNDTEIDSLVIERVGGRVNKVQAPAVLAPSGTWSLDDALRRFTADQDQMIRSLGTASLRGTTAMHPVLGPLDGYQWMLAAAAHRARHLAQIRELKAHPAFPSSASPVGGPGPQQLA